MVKNNVIDLLTIGDFLFMVDDRPELAIDLITGKTHPQVFPAEDAQELLHAMACRFFETRFHQIRPFTYRGTMSNNKSAELSLVQISPENREQLCIQVMAEILNRAANPDPLEEVVRMMLIDSLSRFMGDFQMEGDYDEEE